jgi:acyl dehydratase
MSTSPTLDALHVGDEIPPFVRVTGLANWNRYAAVNDEFIPIHMDDEAGRAAGFPTAFGMGNLQTAYFHAVLREWLGGGGRIAKLSFQFRSPNLKGQTVTARGKVTSIGSSPADPHAELEIWTEDQDGTKLAIGTATVVFNTGAAG